VDASQPLSRLPLPQEIISQCVWLYFNFALSLRDVELMMAKVSGLTALA
jgi:transposase-like protein